MTLERSDSAHSGKYVRLGSDRAAGGTPRGGAPLVQSMVAEGEDIASSMQKLAEKQTQLEAAAAELAAKEVALCADMVRHKSAGSQSCTRKEQQQHHHPQACQQSCENPR
jgi:hypothetical protein